MWQQSREDLLRGAGNRCLANKLKWCKIHVVDSWATISRLPRVRDVGFFLFVQLFKLLCHQNQINRKTLLNQLDYDGTGFSGRRSWPGVYVFGDNTAWLNAMNVEKKQHGSVETVKKFLMVSWRVCLFSREVIDGRVDWHRGLASDGVDTAQRCVDAYCGRVWAGLIGIVCATPLPCPWLEFFGQSACMNAAEDIIDKPFKQFTFRAICFCSCDPEPAIEVGINGVGHPNFIGFWRIGFF